MKTKALFFSGCLTLLLAACAVDNPATYYLDATGGDDTRSGHSAEHAWKSLDKLASADLQPGDTVFFKRGETFQGPLRLSAQGTADRRITLKPYGEGAEKPVIAGQDTSLYALCISNSDYLTVQGLEIVNTGKERLAKRTGLRVEAIDYGVSHHLVIDGVTVRDVNGSLVKAEGGGSGILIVNGGRQTVSTFDSLTIQNCHILRCARNAMIWSGYMDRRDWHPSTHTLVCANLIEQVPGDGIVPIGCDSTRIEYNLMRDCPDLLPETEAAAGIWPWSCDNTLIQYNEVSGHKAPWDAQGFDSDYNCNNTCIQYNYSHDNYGGMVLICNAGSQTDYNCGNRNTVVRHNISINDGLRPKQTRAGMFSPAIHVAGPVKNTLITGNIIHLNTKPAAVIDNRMYVSDSWDGYADSTFVRANLFYAAGESHFVLEKTTANYFDNNYYLGKCRPAPGDAAARLDSKTYAQEILSQGPDGYKGLSGLMEEREICGVKGHFVRPDRIAHFFAQLYPESRQENH